MEEKRNALKKSVGKLKGRDHVENVGVDGRIIIK
jgi:hypothetical protein